MFRKFGIIAPRSNHALIYINGEFNGIFANTENVDGPFTNKHFEKPDGNLYKEVWPVESSGNSQTEDYFVGGKRLGPVITSISYSASNSSAWTLLGVSGVAFSEGISTLWLVIGVVGGMFTSWLKVAPSIYDITKKKNFITIPQLISDGFKETERKNILTTASFIIIFSFTFYIASQFQGAGNALNDTFGLSIFVSIILSAFIIYIYTYLGGYLAVSITDTIQGFLMAFTAIVMPLMAISKIGGFAGLFEKLSTASGDFLSFSAGNVGLSALGLIVGHLGIGMGYFGQPHLLSRFISVKDLKTLEKSRNYALIWFCIVFTGMWLLGIAGHFMITDLSNNENIFFRISDEIFHPAIQGVLLAAAISAIMSTADSQILVCSSSISIDLNIQSDSLKVSRLVTGFVTRLKLTIPPGPPAPKRTDCVPLITVTES